MKKRLIIAVPLVLGLAATALFAQGPPPPQQPVPPPRPMMQGPACPVAALNVPPPQYAEHPPAFLNLTDDQKTKLKDILTKAQGTIRPLQEAASATSRDLMNTVMSPTPDTAKIQSLIEASAKSESQMLKAEIDTWNQIKAILTPEQAKLITNTPYGRPGMMRPGGPAGPGPNGFRPGPGGQGPAKADTSAPPLNIEAPPPAPGQ